jgi:hypothetical protein
LIPRPCPARLLDGLQEIFRADEVALDGIDDALRRMGDGCICVGQARPERRHGAGPISGSDEIGEVRIGGPALQVLKITSLPFGVGKAHDFARQRLEISVTNDNAFRY